VTENLKVKPEEIVYKEEVWSGGGNAGPCVESIIRGLEIATLVFMQYKVIDSEFVKLPIRTVDTGYGIDRYAWLSQGCVSGFHAIYGNLLEKIFEMAEIAEPDGSLMEKVAKASGLVNLDKMASRTETRRKEAALVGMDADELDRLLVPLENAFAVADHTKCLCFILSEGVVPSNIQEGYLARLIFRRVYRLLKMLGIQSRLYDIVDMQIALWSKDFPHLKEMHGEIIELVKVEEEKFGETITRGEGMVKRISADLKAGGKREIPAETLVELYDSHGLPPEIVKQVAEKENLEVAIPDNFYALIAKKHEQVSKPVEDENTEEWLEEAVKGLPETKLLYYEDQYMKEFQAKTLKVIEGEYVVLDQTCFYPEGGGQPADTGHLSFGKNRIEVVDAQKISKVIVHKVKGSAPKEGSMVKGSIDWEKRYSLMKNHTATHVIGGAAKRVLGNHVWQYGTQKGVESSRLDISHHRRLSLEEIHKIETLANMAIMHNIPVEAKWMPRNEAERLYGFRLYQGGAVPGKEIRVVRAGDWDVEACAGTHLANTGEIEFIKIIHTERVQDGVERLTYSTGISAVKAVQSTERLVWKLAETLNAPIDKLNKTAEKLVKELKEANAEKRRLLKDLAERESRSLETKEAEGVEEVDGVKIVKRDFKESIDVDLMIQTANEIVKRDDTAVALFSAADDKNARIIVVAGKTALEKGVDAGEIVKESSAVIGGGGGGKANFAQGGGTRVEKRALAIKKAEDTLRKQLKA
ncbi:MAG: alanine--tRNA ligase, partial [Candidatus Bathyarchaeota archaeon]|nr:alanine--tRNA ligase [Candidatus Bathyarchaeota archaeon]